LIGYCVVRKTGEVACIDDRFLSGPDAPAEKPEIRVTPIKNISDALELTRGPADSLCALTKAKKVMCWGWNERASWASATTRTGARPRRSGAGRRDLRRSRRDACVRHIGERRRAVLGLESEW